MELKTSGNKVIQAKDIQYVLRGKITGERETWSSTLVKLKTGEEVLLENSEEEVVAEMNKPIGILI